MVIHKQLAVWLVSAMTHFVDPASHDFYQPRAATEAHYEKVAFVIADLVLNSTEDSDKPIFGGEDGPYKTALLLAVIPAGETHYNSIIDFGGSVKPGDNDGGKAVGPWQVHLDRRIAPEGWTRDDVGEDLYKGATIAMRRIRDSLRVCRGAPEVQRLGHYGAGGNTCLGANVYQAMAAQRANTHMHRMMIWWKEHPFRPEAQ